MAGGIETRFQQAQMDHDGCNLGLSNNSQSTLPSPRNYDAPHALILTGQLAEMYEDTTDV
jgi:hypothetical protein